MTQAPARPEDAHTEREILVIIAALMLVMLLASLDQTIVSTALPTIVGEFGGLEHLSWIVTAYMLATTVVTPLYGKLGDLFGRKVALQGAIVLFLLGSALCGLTHSMGQLIAYRAVQGLGGGGLMVTSMAAVGDIISPRERGRYQGYFGAVFGVSTVVGPLLGGFFVEHLNWRWIFYINLPLGLLALIVIGAVFTSPTARKSPRIDIVGAATLAVILTAVVLLASLGGQSLPWTSPELLGLAVLAVAGIAVFILVERRVSEPILPLSLFADRTFAVATLVGFIVGFSMFGSITYMPLYLQVVKGVTPSVAGIQLSPMMGGVLLTSIVSGQIISRIGRYRIFPIAGTALMTLALGLLSTLAVQTNTWTAAGFMLLLGLGLGMVMQVLVLAVQNAVKYEYLGVATSGTSMFRSIGGSIGVAVFGAIFAAGLAAGLAGRLPAGANLPAVSDPASLAQLPPELRSIYLEAFVGALQPVFLIATALAVLGFALTWLMKEAPLRGPGRAEDIGDSFAMPRDASSLQELETILARISRAEHRWDMIDRIARRLNLDLAPDEIWLLVQLGRSNAPLRHDELVIGGPSSRGTLDQTVSRMIALGLARSEPDNTIAATDEGHAMFRRMVDGFRTLLAESVERWSPEEHAEVRAMLTNFARVLVSELPRRSNLLRRDVGLPVPE